MDHRYLLALDQGTTSSRAILFGHDGRVIASAHREFPQILPGPGLVEHDPEAIWQSQIETAHEVLRRARIAPEVVAAIGVTNQRETTVVWERETGRPVSNAIVWQSRLSAPECDRLKQEGLEPIFREKTGLFLDPYFSGTKLKHLLDSINGLRARAERGEICFGTVDSWLLWRLTGGRWHATDYSNASRTLLFNIHTLQWDDELLRLLDIPRAMLPEVLPTSGDFGMTDASIFGRPIPITAMVGDQQAAAFGQNCFEPGSVKNTYGTGCFMLMNAGHEPVESTQRLLTTVGWGLGDEVTYFLEGAVFIAGAAVQWLRDSLGIIETSADVERLAATVDDSGGVFFVPAMVGLGAPYWDPYARGAIFGITRGTTAAHLARATVEAIAFQSRDLLEAMQKDAGRSLSVLRVDGGAAVNNPLMQFQADLLGATVERPVVAETTALGAAYLAGLAVGYWESLDEIRKNWALDRRFVPQVDATWRDQRYTRWQEAVRRCMEWEPSRAVNE